MAAVLQILISRWPRDRSYPSAYHALFGAGKAASDYGSLETGSANAFVPGSVKKVMFSEPSPIAALLEPGPGQAIETEESKAAARAKPLLGRDQHRPSFPLIGLRLSYSFARSWKDLPPLLLPWILFGSLAANPNPQEVKLLRGLSYTRCVLCK